MQEGEKIHVAAEQLTGDTKDHQSNCKLRTNVIPLDNLTPGW